MGAGKDGGKHRKTVEDGGGRQETTGDSGGEWGTPQCRPPWSFVLTLRASFGKDRTGRRNVFCRGPAPGRTDCPVANTVEPLSPVVGCSFMQDHIENERNKHVSEYVFVSGLFEVSSALPGLLLASICV